MQQMLPERLRAEYQRIIDDYCAGDCSEDPEQYFLSHASNELASKWKETNTLIEEERASGAMV
ncbi:MAG: hypothetical protein PUF49_05755 [Firmicutes bacterium]|nr:hypothetical protein [Bacillota bacterium]